MENNDDEFSLIFERMTDSLSSEDYIKNYLNGDISKIIGFYPILK